MHEDGRPLLHDGEVVGDEVGYPGDLVGVSEHKWAHFVDLGVEKHSQSWLYFGGNDVGLVEAVLLEELTQVPDHWEDCYVDIGQSLFVFLDCLEKIEDKYGESKSEKGIDVEKNNSNYDLWFEGPQDKREDISCFQLFSLIFLVNYLLIFLSYQFAEGYGGVLGSDGFEIIDPDFGVGRS